MSIAAGKDRREVCTQGGGARDRYVGVVEHHELHVLRSIRREDRRDKVGQHQPPAGLGRVQELAAMRRLFGQRKLGIDLAGPTVIGRAVIGKRPNDRGVENEAEGRRFHCSGAHVADEGFGENRAQSRPCGDPGRYVFIRPLSFMAG